MSVNLRYPNITGRSEKEQINQIKSYLHQLVDHMNYAMPNSGSAQTESQQTAEKQGTEISYYELRSLIIQDLQEVQKMVDQLEAKYVKNEELPEVINEALAQAKASGEFDGYTPVKGVDYFTEEDKTEMVNSVIAAQPKMELLESFTVPEEGLSTIDLTTYQLEAVILAINSPETDTPGTATLQMYHGDICFLDSGAIAASDDSNRAYSQSQEAWKQNGVWHHEMACQVTGMGTAKYVNTQGNVRLESDYPYIDRVTVSLVDMPIGATISIYGAKANILSDSVTGGINNGNC